MNNNLNHKINKININKINKININKINKINFYKRIKDKIECYRLNKEYKDYIAKEELKYANLEFIHPESAEEDRYMYL